MVIFSFFMHHHDEKMSGHGKSERYRGRCWHHGHDGPISSDEEISTMTFFLALFGFECVLRFASHIFSESETRQFGAINLQIFFNLPPRDIRTTVFFAYPPSHFSLYFIAVSTTMKFSAFATLALASGASAFAPPSSSLGVVPVWFHATYLANHQWLPRPRLRTMPPRRNP